MNKILLIITSVLFMVASSYGQTPIDIESCEFPHTFQYDLPNEADSVVWVVESGNATFEEDKFIETSGPLVITSADNQALIIRIAYNLGESIITPYLVQVSGDCGVTQASVGEHLASITACELPYEHTVETNPQNVEEASWEVIEGSATIDYAANGDLTISDASNRAELVYSITNGDFTTYDTLVIEVTEGNGCVSIDQGLNDDIVTCETESAEIHAMVNGQIVEDGDYIYEWSTTSASVSILSPGSASTRFEVYTAGAKIIKLSVYTKLGSHVGESQFTVQSTCTNDGNLVEGTVRADEALWQDGMIYLIDVDSERIIDSVQFTDGTYVFQDVPSGNYTLYAVPYMNADLNELSDDFQATYYVNKLTLLEANSFGVNANTFGLDVHLLEAVTASLEELSSIHASVYPNPFTDEISIESEEGGATLLISNVQGAIVYEGVLSSDSKVINTSDWENGAYFIQFKTESRSKTIKVLK